MTAHLNGSEPPCVGFTYAPRRSGEYASEILQGFGGTLQVDGYAGYNRVLDLRDNAPILLACCWAHARRKLYELTHNNVAQSPRKASSRSQHFTGSKGTSEGNLLTNGWRCDSKNLRQRSRPSKSGWITPERRCQPNPRQKAVDTKADGALKVGEVAYDGFCIKPHYQPLGSIQS
jgi:hypothetical protein